MGCLRNRPVPKTRNPNWLLALDLDGVVWDCEDISLTKPPYIKISENLIRDSLGQEIRLREGVKELLRWVINEGGITATLSWNMPDIARQALKALGIDEYFNYHCIEYHPRKHELLRQLLLLIKNDLGTKLKPSNIVYVDDRIIHIEHVHKKVGKVRFIHFGNEVKNFHNLKETLKQTINELKANTQNTT